MHSEQGLLSCNLFRFQKGERYLVYASGKQSIVLTGSSRSAPLSWEGYVSNELRMLGRGKRPNDVVLFRKRPDI